MKQSPEWIPYTEEHPELEAEAEYLDMDKPDPTAEFRQRSKLLWEIQREIKAIGKYKIERESAYPDVRLLLTDSEGGRCLVRSWQDWERLQEVGLHHYIWYG